MIARLALPFVVAIGLAACAPQVPPVVMSTKSPLELRAMQARLFDTTDRSRMVRAVIGTLQDMGYAIDKVDSGSGTVSATKLAVLRLSAAVMPSGTQTSVRANAFVTAPNLPQTQVDSPVFYQTLFFEPLSRTIFLQAKEDTAATTPAQPPPMPAKLAVPSDKPTS